ncbi:kinase-like protein [Jaminaea rosea]|uniref:non-specific serine/threonine protein kinase n=1 Tax=Jaminaea rosea TaxID=1569628 RepID=A0A316UK56_9BASI|nr:kinase-like protein [Jaminaea rosea]PWN25682.1 kinase-like protein [Jaminaea rosea]
MSQPNGRVLLQQSGSANKNLAASAATPAHHGKTESVITTHVPAAAPKTRSQHLAAAAASTAPPATPGARLERAGAGSSNDASANVEDSKGSWRSWTRGEGLQPSELEIANMPEVRRKANVCQLYFLNHYFDSLRYLSDRKTRLAHFEMTCPPDPASTHYKQDAASYFGRERALLRKRRTKLRVAQFHIITQVGQGGYGEVFLARKRETGQICALKKLRKRVLVKMDEVRHVLIERDILTATRTPWLVRLLYAFQDTEHVYLAMEYVPGGDFRTLLNNAGILHQEFAQFYMAEMLVAVNEVHKLGYIHRDLKPENFLIDIDGHIKLTDFGLAAGALNPTRIDSLRHRLEQVKDTDFVYRTPAERGSLYKAMRAGNVHYADSIVGSPDYMAPEVLRGKTYGYSVDYWSLGCMLYEQLAGFPPFSGGKPEETWANLKNWQKVLQRPVYTRKEDLQFNLSDDAWDCIKRLIDTPDRRYSSLSSCQAHPFFSSLDFTSLRTLKTPFVPSLKNETDTSHFDDFDDPADMAKYKEVQEKQRNVEGIRERKSGKEACGGLGVWAGFTFGKNGVGANGRSMPASQSQDLCDAFQTMF